MAKWESVKEGNKTILKVVFDDLEQLELFLEYLRHTKTKWSRPNSIENLEDYCSPKVDEYQKIVSIDGCSANIVSKFMELTKIIIMDYVYHMDRDYVVGKDDTQINFRWGVGIIAEDTLAKLKNYPLQKDLESKQAELAFKSQMNTTQELTFKEKGIEPAPFLIRSKYGEIQVYAEKDLQNNSYVLKGKIDNLHFEISFDKEGTVKGKYGKKLTRLEYLLYEHQDIIFNNWFGISSSFVQKEKREVTIPQIFKIFKPLPENQNSSYKGIPAAQKKLKIN